ncbi:MAG TPA: hypothetical protein VMT33_01365, partial [Candidatus Bathyarchaeia archaeon]|nr:hypothetical protein [Candidatus Bathyarchaeia archaeon]
MTGRRRGSLCVSAMAIAVWSAAGASDLTFEDRVRAQEAIERVYYAHQIGATKPFPEAIPRSVLERKVRTYLGQSAALEDVWSTPVTAEALDAELHRMLAGTQDPGRLRELFEALENDPLLVRECLVRPALVDRLARRFVAADGTEVSWGEWWDGNASRFEGRRVDVVASTEPLPLDPRAATGSCPPDDVWDNRGLDEPPDGRNGHTAVWTGSVMIVWGGGGNGDSMPTGSRYDPATDSWSSTSLTGSPSGRRDHFAVWTGSEMIGWGGTASGSLVSTGGRYDPVSDTWAPMSAVDAPAGRVRGTAVWTGTLFVVWGGGTTPLDTGGRYDPVSDSWAPTSIEGAPSARFGHSGVWTGSRMVIWSGVNSTNTGGRYDPVSNTWATTTTAGAPPGRYDATGVW